MRMVGGDLAARYPERFGFDRHDERQPCPFCGHPTGDCAEEDHLMTPTKAAAKKAPAKKKADAPVVRSDNQGEEREVSLADIRSHALTQQQIDRDGLRVVTEDVWYDRPSPGAPDVPLHLLRFHAGQVVNAAQLDAAEADGIKGVKTRKATFEDG